jgi:hypothetical protein
MARLTDASGHNNRHVVVDIIVVDSHLSKCVAKHWKDDSVILG